MTHIDNKRVKAAFKYLKDERIIYNQTDFAKLLNKHVSYISEIINGRRKVSEKFINLMCDSFPILNSHWLLTDEGNMLKKDIITYPKAEEIISINDFERSKHNITHIATPPLEYTKASDTDAIEAPLLKQIKVLQEKYDTLKYEHNKLYQRYDKACKSIDNLVASVKQLSSRT